MDMLARIDVTLLFFLRDALLSMILKSDTDFCAIITNKIVNDCYSLEIKKQEIDRNISLNHNSLSMQKYTGNS